MITLAADEVDPWRDFEDGFVSTTEGEIFYRHRPAEGRSIIFLHGIGAETKSWRKIVPFLSKRLDIYMPDLLGHGRSDKPRISYDIKMYVRSLDEFVRKVNLRNFVLFGHSHGGWISARYALQKKIDGLILEDIGGLQILIDELTRTEGREEFGRRIVEGSAKIGGDPYVAQSIVDNFASDMLTDNDLANITCKTLVIWGSDDDVVDPKYANEVSSNIKGSKLVMIENGGHVPHRTKPEAVGDAISQFCKALEQTIE